MEFAIDNCYFGSAHLRSLQSANLSETVDIGFAVRRGDTLLLAILNKGIQETGDYLIQNSLILYSGEETRYTTGDFLRENVLIVLAVCVAVAALIAGILYMYCAAQAQNRKRMSEAHHQISQARWEAAHDVLTGLLNRSSLLELCKKMRNTEMPFALMMLDVDNFKGINDTYGHEAGDRALQKVSRLLSSSFRDEDYVIRFAGDEFLVFILGITSDASSTIVSKINRINEKLQIADDETPGFSVSAGITFSKSGYREELFRQADQALYCTKERGRCGCCVYSEGEREGLTKAPDLAESE
jgi:diguanylate cyclase (GGDEF)-like protein